MEPQINKNTNFFDIDFENIKQGTITTKKITKERSPKTVEVIPNIEDPNEINKEQVLYQCSNCGRKFKREAYAKHVPICARVFQNKKENDVIEKKTEKKEKLKQNKGNSNKSKWENQSNELRAIIQSKRAEKDKNKNEIKIEVEEPKKHIDNINNNKKLGSPTNNNNDKRVLYSRDIKGFLQCELCNKKFTKINFENHLNDCKLKYNNKKNGTFFNRGNIGNTGNNNINNNNNQMSRKPMLPAVTYGRSKPNFSVKFGK